MAEIAKEYLIRIVAEGGTTGATMQSIDGGGTTNPTPIAPSNKASNIKQALQTAGVINFAKGIANFAVSNIGEFTGSNRIQEQVNFQMKLLGYGIMMSNPATAPLALASIGLEMATNTISRANQRYWNEYQLSQERLRVGKIISNRSR